MNKKRAATIKLSVIAAIFVIFGLWALFDMIQDTKPGHINLRIDVIELPIGIFLFLKRPNARKLAIAYSVLAFVISILGILISIFGTEISIAGNITEIQARAIVASLCVFLAILSYWIYRSLRSTDIVVLFDIPKAEQDAAANP